jgi:MOSC domain-containing protein YiiM
VAGRLVSVNVGRPRDVQWDGRTVRTAVWKNPVTGPVMVHRGDIDGDEQADKNGHGGEHRAVFVYQLDSYRYWVDHLGRDDFEHGQFGENFTVEGLSDDEVCIGDRYRSARRSPRSRNRGRRASASGFAWTSLTCRPCSSPAAALAFIYAS